MSLVNIREVVAKTYSENRTFQICFSLLTFASIVHTAKQHWFTHLCLDIKNLTGLGNRSVVECLVAGTGLGFDLYIKK